MSTDSINTRVDQALADNRRAENIIVCMAVGIFLLGIIILIFGFWTKNVYFAGGGFVSEGFLYWPIREVLKLRRDNIILQALPSMVSILPRDRAAEEVSKFFAYLMGRG